jgi:hypothetical protein
VSISDTPLPPDDGPHHPLDNPADAASPEPRARAVDPFEALLWRWLLAAPVGIVLAVIVAAAVWYFLPPGPSTAYVKLYMPMHVEGNFGDHPEAGIDFAAFQRTQFALLRSRPVLDAALRDPRVQKLDLQALTKGLDPADWLEKQIRVETPEGLDLPRVVMSGDNPEQLKILLSAVVDAYLDQVVDKRTMAHRVQRLEKLDAVRKLYENRLKSIRETNRKLALAVGGGNNDKLAELRLELSMKELADAKQQLVKVHSELRQLEFDAAIAEKNAKVGAGLDVPDRVLEERVEKALEKELAARDKLQADLVKARAMSTEGASDPKVREMAAALEKQKAVIDEQRKALGDVYREELQRQAQDAARADLARLQEKIKNLKALEETLGREVEQLVKLDNKLKNDALDLGESQVELKLAEAGYQKVMGEIDALKVEVDAPRRVSKWEEAVVVPPDDGPRKRGAAALVGLGVLGIVLLLACFVEFPWRRGRPAAEVVEGAEAFPDEDLPLTPDAIPGE